MLTKNELRELAEWRKPWSISIFMPTHPVGAEGQQDPIRLRNLLAVAERKLTEAGARAPDAKKWLEPARELLNRSAFWNRQGHGLALFLAPNQFYSFRLPLQFEELVVVGDRFHIKPLLPLVTGDGRFLLLALSQGEVRLLEGTRDSVNQVELDVPENLETALEHLGAAPSEKQLQSHTRTQSGDGRRSAVFHGVSEVQDKEKLRMYFRQIDAGIREALPGEQAPLVLAGVEYLLPIYREVSDYPQLLAAGLVGNPETARPEELRARAWELVQPLFAAAREQAAARYQQLAGAGSERASADLEQIVPAAYHGRVETLFVALGLQQWGEYDAEKEAVSLHDEQRPGDQDLLDFAAAHTYLNGGAVYAVAPEAAPGGAAAAAVFRY